MHLAVPLENSTLRRISNFFSSCFSGFPWSYENPPTFGCNRTFRGWGTCRNMRRQVHSWRVWFCHNSLFSHVFLHSLRHRFGAANQAGILRAEKRAEMAGCWTNEEDCSIRHVWNYLWWKRLRVDFLVSIYLIWILGSRLIFSDNQSKSTLWVLDTCLIAQIIFHWSNCVPTKVQWRLWPKDSISRPSTMRNLINWVWGFMSRVHFTSRQLIIQRYRMDPWQHEDWSSFGESSQFPSRKLRNRDHDQLFFCRWDSFLGDDHEWNKQVAEMTEESMTLETVPGNRLLKQDINADDFFSNGYVIISPAWLDWRRTRTVGQELLRSVEKDDKICSEEDGAVELRILAPMFHWKFSSSPCWSIPTWMIYLQKGGGPNWEEISEMCGFILCWHLLIPSSISRPLWRKTHWSYFARQRVVTERHRRALLPRWKLPRCALDSGWQRRQERDMRCSYGREPIVHRSP